MEKKNDLFALCCVHKIAGKVKEYPFYGSHSLKVAVTQNMRSQLSWFCFILNKLFLLRKSWFFCLEVNWRQTLWPPLFAAEGFRAAAAAHCLISQLWVLSEKRHFGLDQPLVPERKESSWLSCRGPPLWWQWKRGSLAALLLTLTGKRCWCWHARSRGAPPCIWERWPSLGLRWFEELELLNFKFVISFVHPPCLALVLILSFFGCFWLVFLVFCF